MSNNPLPYDAGVIGMVNNWTANLNGGFIKIYTGAQPGLNGSVTGTLLVTCNFSPTAFGAATASAGIVSAAASVISVGVAVATGTAGYHVLLKSDGTTVVGTGTCGVGSNFDLQMTQTAITFGGTVQIAAYSVSMAEA